MPCFHDDFAVDFKSAVYVDVADAPAVRHDREVRAAAALDLEDAPAVRLRSREGFAVHFRAGGDYPRLVVVSEARNRPVAGEREAAGKSAVQVARRRSALRRVGVGRRGTAREHNRAAFHYAVRARERDGRVERHGRRRKIGYRRDAREGAAGNRRNAAAGTELDPSGREAADVVRDVAARRRKYDRGAAAGRRLHAADPVFSGREETVARRARPCAGVAGADGEENRLPVWRKLESSHRVAARAGKLGEVGPREHAVAENGQNGMRTERGRFGPRVAKADRDDASLGKSEGLRHDRSRHGAGSLQRLDGRAGLENEVGFVFGKSPGPLERRAGADDDCAGELGGLGTAENQRALGDVDRAGEFRDVVELEFAGAHLAERARAEVYDALPDDVEVLRIESPAVFAHGHGVERAVSVRRRGGEGREGASRAAVDGERALALSRQVHARGVVIAEIDVLEFEDAAVSDGDVERVDVVVGRVVADVAVDRKPPAVLDENFLRAVFAHGQMPVGFRRADFKARPFAGDDEFGNAAVDVVRSRKVRAHEEGAPADCARAVRHEKPAVAAARGSGVHVAQPDFLRIEACIRAGDRDDACRVGSRGVRAADLDVARSVERGARRDVDEVGSAGQGVVAHGELRLRLIGISLGQRRAVFKDDAGIALQLEAA